MLLLQLMEDDVQIDSSNAAAQHTRALEDMWDATMN